MGVSSTTLAMGGGRKLSVAAAALIGIGLTLFVNQAIGFNGSGLFFLSLGVGFFVAYLNVREAGDLIVPAGVLTGLGLGCTLGCGGFLPEYLHGPMVFGGLALGFAAIYLLGGLRYRWAMWPATGFAVLAWLTFMTSVPWLADTFGAVLGLFWPLLLVAGGLWLIERSRRRNFPN